MIEGYVKNGKITCNTNLKTIDDNNYFLAIDGLVEDDYYKYIIDNYNNKKYDFINDIKDFISIYLFDKKNKELLLITDRIGAKKIYYTNINNTFYFSNDIRNLKIKKKTINVEALSMYFRYYCIQEPYTIFKDVYKIEHGKYLINKNKEIHIEKYWSVVDTFNKRVLLKNYKKTKKELNDKLKNIIKNSTINKKNVGVYVSGGVDSNIVASLYSKIKKEPINTFTIGFENNKYDESGITINVSKILKSNNHILPLEDDKAYEYVKKITDYYGEPFGDISAISTIALNEYARKNNIKIALTGDGSDQLFCGSNIYETMNKIRLASFINPFHIHINDKYLKNKYLFYIFSKTPKKYKTQIDVIYDEKKLEGLFKDNGEKRIDVDNIKTNNIQEKRMILDIDTFMAQRVFPKMCVAANRNNIEIISPFLTKEMIEFSFSVPHKYKYHKRIRKYILKEILYSYIPKETFDKKKSGFVIPTKEWLKGKLNDDLNRLSKKDFIEKQNIFNYDKVQSIINNIDDNKYLVWNYYMFQLWYEKNMKNKKRDDINERINICNY